DDRSRASLAAHRELDVRAFLAAKHRAVLIEREAFRGLAVDEREDIARLDTGFLRRPALYRLDDLRRLGGRIDVDEDADAWEVAAVEPFVQATIFLRIHEDGPAIVERLHHPF